MTRKTKQILIGISVAVMLLTSYHYFSPYKLQFIGYYNKIWAHRVNSTQKLHSALNYFDGVELDLVYQNGVLDVNHPPTESIGLNFETYLASLHENEKPNLWLDIKNLKKENALDIFLSLNKIFLKCNYPKNKILIETRFPEALQPFHKAGYKTSYYINPVLKSMNDTEAFTEIKHIKEIISDQLYLGLSSNYKDYSRLSEAFPNTPLYLWVLNSDINKDFFKVRRLLKDPMVKVVLVRFNAISGNR